MLYRISEMAEEVGECSVNNTLPLENVFSVNAVKEEEEYNDENFIDDKIQISETAIVTELQDNLTTEKIKQYNISTTLDNIKTELSLEEVQSDMIDNNFKMEEGISADNIRIEFNKGLLYCEDCQAYREDYCAECEMLVLILNKIPFSADNKSQVDLPNSNILEVRDYFGEYRIFAVKVIPVGVKFGPFIGLNTTDRPWKIKGGKFVVNEDQSSYLNWMQYINPARNIFEQNLQVFQYDNKLYYQSTRQIEEGHELLVYFGDEYKDSLNRNVEIDFIPTTEHVFKDAFACTYCCLGYSSKSYLEKHKGICPWNVNGAFSIEELVQCPSCKIHLDREEYLTHHMAYCCKRNDRKYILPTLNNRIPETSRRKTRQQQIYKCQQCKYKTKYKRDFNDHTNHHYEVKMYKCGICFRRFKTKDALRLHVESTHIYIGKKGNLERCTEVYMKAHIKAEHLCTLDEMKQFKCTSCEFRTKYKISLKRHMKVKHLVNFQYKCDTCDHKAKRKLDLKIHKVTKHAKEFKYKCGTCDYKTNRKDFLRRHIETRHLNEFKYKCDTCDYKTSLKYSFKNHIEAKHLKEFKYNCDICDYKTSVKYSLTKHIERKHLKEFKYKCDICDYKSYGKSNLKIHIETTHLNEFKYKCEICDYKTNVKFNLKTHMEAKHLKEFKYKCNTCDYKTNVKSNVNRHIKTKHLKEFKHKCDTCDYKTNVKYNLMEHTEAKHLREFKHKCDTCDYKTNVKSNLKTHVGAKHLKEFKYKCDTCDYKANLKSNLKRHIERRHLREFKYKCDTCNYKANDVSNLKKHMKSKHP